MGLHTPSAVLRTGAADLQRGKPRSRHRASSKRGGSKGRSPPALQADRIQFALISDPI